MCGAPAESLQALPSGQGVPSGSLMSTWPFSSLPGSQDVRGAGCVGSNHIEAEDTDEDHANDRRGKKKGFPTGLKGNTLHVRLPALTTADVR